MVLTMSSPATATQFLGGSSAFAEITVILLAELVFKEGAELDLKGFPTKRITCLD
jgi:hypothetical protein